VTLADELEQQTKIIGRELFSHGVVFLFGMVARELGY